SDLAPTDDAWRSKFNVAFTGNVRSSGAHNPAGVHDPARAAQFELFTAASCRNAGGWPRHEEPDVLVDVGIKTLAIAAKRITSLPRLEEHVRKGRNQILGTFHTCSSDRKSTRLNSSH